MGEVPGSSSGKACPRSEVSLQVLHGQTAHHMPTFLSLPNWGKGNIGKEGLPQHIKTGGLAST